MHRTEKKAKGFCFWGGNRGTFCLFVVESVGARACLKLLENLVFQVLQRINGRVGDAEFQQDSAPVHTASVVTEWFEQYKFRLINTLLTH